MKKCGKCYEISDGSGVFNEAFLCITVHRHHKCIRFGYVTVYPDYALLPVHLSIPPNIPHTSEPLPTFCVEVKPKQGWVPAPDRRLPKCTFCLNQYLKVRSHSLSQTKHQLDATLCRFYFCIVTLHVSGASAHRQEYLKLVRRPLVHVLSLQVSHHISLLGPEAIH